MDIESDETTYNFAALLLLLRSPDLRKRLHAAEALGNLGDSRAVTPLLNALPNADVALRTAVMQAFCRLGALAVPELCALVQERRRTAESRADATSALGIIGLADVSPALHAALCDPEPFVRLRACGAIGRLQSPGIITTLIGCLSDIDGPVRQKAARTLGHIGDTSAISPLIRLLHHGDAWDRSAVTTALGSLTMRHPVPELRQAIPVLRRLSSRKSDDPVITGYRKLAAQIEAATASIKDLPLPSQPTQNSLPLPASAPTNTTERLPIPASNGHERKTVRRSLFRFRQRD